MTRRFLTAALIVLALSPAVLRGQTVSSPYRFLDDGQSLGAGAGWLLTDPGSLELGPKSAIVPHVRYSLRISGPFIGEATVAWLPTERAVVDTANVDSAGNVTGPLGTAETGIMLTLAALRFDVTGPRTWNNLLPYVLAGAGFAIELGEDEDADAALPSDVRYDFGTSFAALAGAGVEWLPTRSIGVQLDVRDIIWEIQTPAPFLLPDRPVPESEWVQNFLFSAGVTIRF